MSEQCVSLLSCRRVFWHSDQVIPLSHSAGKGSVPFLSWYWSRDFPLLYRPTQGAHCNATLIAGADVRTCCNGIESGSRSYHVFVSTACFSSDTEGFRATKWAIGPAEWGFWAGCRGAILVYVPPMSEQRHTPAWAFNPGKTLVLLLAVVLNCSTSPWSPWINTSNSIVITLS